MLNQPVVPQGVTLLYVPHAGRSQPVSFLLLPQFSLLAFSSAVEVLRVANQLAARPLFSWQVLSEGGGPVASSGGLSVNADAGIEAVPPAGMVFACAGIRPEAAVHPAAVRWLRRAGREAEIVGGLCTGAYALARAGLLAGRRVTMHWENLPAFRAIHPEIAATEQLYCIDGKVWTCAGGTAAADLMLAMLRAQHGPRLADLVLAMILQERQRAPDQPQRPRPAAGLPPRSALARMTALMEARMAEIGEVGEVADQIGLSRRQMERLFRSGLGTTPRRHLSGLRIARAESLLQETTLPGDEIARQCGFVHAGAMRRALRSRARAEG